MKQILLSTMLALFSGMISAGITSPIHAALISPTSRNPHEVHSVHHPIFHALAQFFHISYPTAKTTTRLKLSTVTNSAQASQNQNQSFSKHIYGEIFGPYSYKPSVKTEKNSAGKIPVIVVHGTWANGNWMSDIYHSLDKAGIPTYVSTFGTGGPSLAGLVPFIGGVAPTEKSEKQLADYIDKVQKETGASKVNLIGHSQGGLIIKDYIAHDTKNNIQTVIDLGATNHGTTLGNVESQIESLHKMTRIIVIKILTGIFGQGAADQRVNSNFIQNLNRYPDTKAGIHYLVLSDKDDTTSTPYQNTYLKPVPGADVTNLEIHSLPGVTGNVGHLDMLLNPGVIQAITHFIETQGESSPAKKPTISPNLVSSRTNTPLKISLL